MNVLWVTSDKRVGFSFYTFLFFHSVCCVCVCVCRYHFPHAFFLLHATRVLLASFYGHILPFIRLLRRYGCIRITDQDARAFM